MSAQNGYARFIQRSIQVFVLMLIGWLLPEVIFYFIHFDEAERYEIRRFIVALFMGFFMLNLIRAVGKKIKKRVVS